MERVAHGQGRDFVAGFLEQRHCLLDCLTGAANHGLALAVDVGDYGVAVHGSENSFDFLEGRKDRGHLAVVPDRDTSHPTSTGTDSFQRVFKRKSARGNQGAVFAQAVAHREIGRDAIGS